MKLTLDDLELAIEGKRRFRWNNQPYDLFLPPNLRPNYHHGKKIGFCWATSRGAYQKISNVWREYCNIHNAPCLTFFNKKTRTNICLDLFSVDYLLTENALQSIKDIIWAYASRNTWGGSGTEIIHAKELQLTVFDNEKIGRKILEIVNTCKENKKYPSINHGKEKYKPIGVDELLGRETKPMSVQLYKEGQALAIQTDCQTEEAFTEQFCELLTMAIDGNTHAGEWEFHLRQWLPQFVELCNAYRGYKAKVTTKTIYTSGDITPGEPLHRLNDVNGVVTNNKTAWVAPAANGV